MRKVELPKRKKKSKLNYKNTRLRQYMSKASRIPLISVLGGTWRISGFKTSLVYKTTSRSCLKTIHN